MSPFLTDELSPEVSPELSLELSLSLSLSQGGVAREKSYLHKTVVAMVTKLLWQQSMSLMPIVLRKLYTNYELNRIQDKRVIYITLWLP